MDYKRLDDATVVKYAQKAALKLGIKLPEPMLLFDKMSLAIPQPIILCNGEFQLWVDRYYIAYSRFDEDSISYVYLSKHHIKEEVNSFQIAARKSGMKVDLPNSIRNPFIRSLEYMKSSDTDYYIDRAFFTTWVEKVDKSPKMSKTMMLKW